MTRECHFIQPLDVLFLRGNKLFGEAGSFGEAMVPPWPSVAAGALRSALLAHRGHDPARFADGAIDDAELGTPSEPGSFRLTRFHLARRHADGATEPLLPLPADLAVEATHDGQRHTQRLAARRPDPAVASSAATEAIPVLAQAQRSKPETGLWLTAAGWRKHLHGQAPDGAGDLVATGELWGTDVRVGVGLDRATGAVAEGRLFANEAVAPRQRQHAGFDTGFVAEVTGATLPDRLGLRFGGDGRGANAERADVDFPEPDYAAIARSGRCRIVLTAPGWFDGGWLPTGARADGGEHRFALHGVAGRLVCAAVPGAQTISGFDLAAWRPKAAHRVAPAGSVYWLEDLEATPEALRKLAEAGLWPEDMDNEASGEAAVRRAEGFNRIAIAAD